MSLPASGHGQAGIGLVEIMVALAIGLVLVAGLTQIYVSSKQGFRVQEAQARLQENARLASVLLSSGIAKAEFQRNAQDDPANRFPATAPAITGTDDYSSGAPAGTLPTTDTITIRFQRDGIMTDCLGSDGVGSPQNPLTAPGTIATNVYRVSSQNVLQCNNGVMNGFQPLVDDVDDMQTLYGEDTNSDGSVDRYVNAAAVGDFDDVLSAHVAVLLASTGDVKPAATGATYNLLDTSVTVPPGQDRIQRRVVERVISLRNRLR
jgi:type IV pilus assembly protein PilW